MGVCALYRNVIETDSNACVSTRVFYDLIFVYLHWKPQKKKHTPIENCSRVSVRESCSDRLHVIQR